MDPLTAEEVATLKTYVGRTESRKDVLSAETLRRFAAAVGADLDVERRPPPLAHWAFFLEVTDADGLGEDGHPVRGGFLPPVPLPRRMFAASKMRFDAPLILGAAGELRLTLQTLNTGRASRESSCSSRSTVPSSKTARSGSQSGKRSSTGFPA